MELSNERYWTTDGRPRDLETTFLQDFFSVFKRSGALSTANRAIIGDTSISGTGSSHGNGSSRAKEARKQALSIESRDATQSPNGTGYGRAFTSSPSNEAGKDDKNYDSDPDAFSKNARFRKISFAGPRQSDAISAV